MHIFNTPLCSKPTRESLLKKQLSIISSTYVFPFPKKVLCTSEIYTHAFNPTTIPYFSTFISIEKRKKKTGELFSALQPHYQLPIPKSSSLVSILFSNISKLYITLFFDFPSSSSCRRHRHNLHTQKHSSSSSYQVIMGFVSVKYKV